MNALLRVLFRVRYPYRTTFDRDRALTLLAITLLLIALWGVGLVLPLLLVPVFDPTLSLIYVGLALPLVLVVVLVQVGRLEWAVRLFMVLAFSVAFPIVTTLDVPALPALLIIPLIAGAVLVPRRLQRLLLAGIVGILAARLYAQSSFDRIVRITPSETVGVDLVLFGTVLSLSAGFLLINSGSVQRASARAAQVSALLRGVGGFRAGVVGVYDEERILIRALELVQTELGYTLASAYRLNELGSFTRIRLGGVRGEVTRIDIRLSEDGSAVGDAARKTQPMIAGLGESGGRSGHILPPANWSISLPLVNDMVLLGVLDIQTDNPDGFTEDERDGFAILIGQIAGALIEARDFRELQRIAREQEEMLARYRTQIGETEQRTQQALASAWDRYVQVRTSVGDVNSFGFDLQRTPTGDALTPAADLPQDIRQALSAGAVHVEAQPDMQVVRAPVMFRGEILGALAFRIPPDRPLTERQIDLLRAVSDRLGVALENTRLFEQSQALAQRERRASEIGSLLIAATDIETVLNLAVNSFNDALGAVRTRVVLESPQVDAPAPPASNGDAANGAHHTGKNGSAT